MIPAMAGPMRLGPRWRSTLSLILLLGCSGLIDPEQYQPLPSFELLDFDLVQPSAPFLLWELREGGIGGPHRVVAGGGTGSRSAIPAGTLAEFDGTRSQAGFDVGCLPGYCYKYLVTLQGNTILVWETVESLIQFLGTINNSVEAAMVAQASGYYWDGAPGTGLIRDVLNGHELVVLRAVKFCAPVQTDRVVVVVSAAGLLRVLRREIWERDSEMCV
jgi:hypothetical protein